MKQTIRRLLGVLVTVLGAVPCAQGQQIPPIAEGDPIVRTTLSANRLTMRDAENDFPIILPDRLLFDNVAPGMTGSVRLQEQPTGCDLIYTFTNTGTQPVRLSRLCLGKFNLGNNIHYRDYRYTGAPKLVDYNNYAFQAFTYPHGVYSPVWTLYNEDYALSVSLQYPVMSYKHDARVLLGSTSRNAPISEGPRGWWVEYRLGNIGDESEAGRLVWPGFVPAGETWTYVVSIRVTKNQNEWIRTLVPYRDYFRSMYGGVQYERDPRPLLPVLVAVNHLISENNPYGYDNYQNRRPDLYGWRPWADYLKSRANKWSRIMLWLPSGLYNENRQQNFPYQFTSRWETEPRIMADVFDDDIGLASVHRSGISLGLWWGRAVQVSRGWNSGQWESFDPDNPAHVQSALHELDLAVRAGATEIGLDTFNAQFTPIWKLVPWLERMREMYPTVKFCVEPVTCDLLHRLGSTYVLGWAVGQVRQESDLYRINNPFYLADLLVPGHESWGGMAYHVHRANNYPVTPELVQRDMERLASMGYVPVMSTLEPPNPQNVRAAESWVNTLPSDVLRGSGWNSNFNRPSAIRRPDGRLVIVNDSGGAPPRPTRTNGRVGGAVPERLGGGVNPNGNSDDDRTGGATPEPEVVAAPAAPIERTKRKINGSIHVQHGKGQPGQNAPAEADAIDFPGSHNTVAVPGNAGSKGKGRAPTKSNPAWLEAMTRKGMIDRTKINQAVKKMRSQSSSGAEPPVVVAPSK